MIKAVLFDLDGTLLDTALDLATAMNLTLDAFKREPVNYESFRASVFGGANHMVSSAFNIAGDHDEFEHIKKTFLTHYATQVATQNILFDGVPELLQHLNQVNLPWGIVTNKSMRYAIPVLEKSGLKDQAQCLVAGDTLEHSKPHPAPLLHACDLLQQQPHETLYIGDYKTDVIAARAANMPNLIVTYGYYPTHESPHDWQADILFDTAHEILTWLKKT